MNQGLPKRLQRHYFACGPDSEPFTRAELLIAAFVFVVCFVLAAGSAATYAPYIDEAYYSMPAWNLAVNGSMGTPVLEPSGSPIPGHDVSLLRVREHSYWNTMPLSIILQAGWFKMVGFSLLKMRLYSSLWALALLAAWFLMVLRLTASARIAVLSVLLIASDETFLIRSGFGRMDMMSAALGFWGLEFYMRYRQRSLQKALLLGNTGVVAAALSHPNGGMLSLLGLIFLVIKLDRSDIRRQHIPAVLAPFLAGGLAMGFYILQDPRAFTAQFFRNSTGRLSVFSNLLSLVPREGMRYLSTYGLGLSTSSLSRIKLFVLVVYAASMLFVWFNASLRRRYATFAGLSAVYILGLAFVDNYRFPWYLVYIIPFFGVGTALAAVTLAPKFSQSLVAVVLISMVTIQTAAVARLNFRDDYRNTYRPVIDYLKAHASPGAIVMGNSELSFDYGFDGGLVDDLRLGYRTGKRPDFVVVEERYLAAWKYYRSAEPEVYAYGATYLRDRCRAVPINSSYTIYVCHPATNTATTSSQLAPPASSGLATSDVR